jgi:hypothetical protein
MIFLRKHVPVVVMIPGPSHAPEHLFFFKNHNLISFAHIHMILVPTRPHFSLLSPYVLTKKIKRLGIVPGT